jgi:hypothetical protein
MEKNGNTIQTRLTWIRRRVSWSPKLQFYGCLYLQTFTDTATALTRTTSLVRMNKCYTYMRTLPSTMLSITRDAKASLQRLNAWNNRLYLPITTNVTPFAINDRNETAPKSISNGSEQIRNYRCEYESPVTSWHCLATTIRIIISSVLESALRKIITVTSGKLKQHT